jgi:hypothetical protein
MKKLAIIIGLAVVSLAGPLAQSAGAKPPDLTPLVQSTTVKPLPAVALELGSGQRLAVQGMTPNEYRALMIRSEALNQRYGLGGIGSVTRVKPHGMTPDEYRALIIRSEALNQKYGLGGIGSLTLERGASQRFASDNPTKDELVTSTPTETSIGFAWNDAGIVAGALLAAMGIATASVVRVRHHGRLGTS